MVATESTTDAVGVTATTTAGVNMVTLLPVVSGVTPAPPVPLMGATGNITHMVGVLVTSAVGCATAIR